MVYIYDILLNFNNDFYEFYEWEKNDPIFHIKRMPILKVETEFIDDLLTKKIVIDDSLVMSILNKCEVFDNKKVKTLKYACVFTDTYRVVGVILNDNYMVSKISDLLLDEALDAIDISRRCTLVNPAYTIVGNKKDYSFLTRREVKIKKYLLSELKNAYKEQDKEKLEYLYFEYFGKIETDELKIIEDLKESLKTEVNERHLMLFELLKLASTKKVDSKI